MALMTSLLMVALAVLCLTNTDGFSISRTGHHLTSRDRQNPDLKDAVRILQRQRRRVREEEYIDPRSAMLLSRGNLDDLWAAGQDVRPDQLWLSQALELGPYADAYPEDFADEPSFRGPLPLHKEVEPSDEELDDIFRKDEDDDDKEDNKIIVPAKEAAKIAALAAAEEEDSEKKKKSEKKSSPSSLEAKVNGEGDSVTLSKEEFRALMSAVKKLEKEISSDDAKGAIVAASSSPAHKEPVSQEELAQVFEAAEQEDGDNATQDGKGEIEVIDETLPDTAKPVLDNAALQSAVTALASQGALEKPSKELNQMDKYLLLKSIYDQQQQEDDDKRKKRAPMKRSGMTMPKMREEEEEARDYDGLSLEIANLVKEIEKLRYLAKLEDMENDALTEALNEATIGQIEGVVSPREAKAIQRAIHIEEALNQLPIRDEISGPPYLQGIDTDVTGDDAEGDEEDDFDIKAKRGEPVWRKREEDEEEEEEKERALQAFQDDLGTWYNQPLAEEPSPEEPLDDQEERDRLIWELSKQLAPAEEKELDEDYKVCPAVAALSTNCQFADDYNLPIDNEARELCNRHQICYSCGGSFSITAEVCDGGFRSEADRLCGDDSTCQVEAELFLRALQLKHAFQQHQLPICQQTACAAEYVGLV